MAITGRRVTRLAKLLLDVAWWLALVGPVVGVVLLLAWPVVAGGGIDPMTEFRVSVPDEAAAERLPIVSGDTVVAADPVLKDVEATLEFRTTVLWPYLLGAGVVIPGLAALLFGLHLGRSFLRDVLAEEVFTAGNARRLSWLGWLMIGAGLVWPVLVFLYKAVLWRSADLGGVPLAVGMDGPPLLIPGIMVLVLASAWRYGVELQRDHDLTV